MITVWTDEMIAELKSIADEKKSGSDIADHMNKKFGLSLTRSAICGKAWRLGVRLLSVPYRTGRVIKRQTVQDRGGAGFATAIGNRNAMRLLADPRAPQAFASRVPEPAPMLRSDGQPHDVLSITAGVCKWPVAGVGKHTRFCGHKADGSATPYCAHHEGRAIMHAKLEAAEC